MKTQRFFLITLVSFLTFYGCQTAHQEETSKSNEGIDIDLILSKMSTKEKVGQMTQLNLDVISKGEIFNLIEPHQLDTAKLRKAIVEYGVGSILNVGGHAYTQEHWQAIISTIQSFAQHQTKSKIPVLYGIDAIHGANYLANGTLLPQPLAQAATFNRELVRKGSAITAYETRACGIPWNFSPVLDVARQPLWSRVFETYGEDVYLCQEMGAAAIKGYQGEDASDPYHVASCLKHFLGYSWSFTGKDRTTAYIPERQLREYFLPPFQSAIKAGALSVMINSGDINGIPVHADKHILTTLLRHELGFDGVAVTDWEDIIKLEQFHKVAPTLKEAVKMAINAGIDMSMVPNNYEFSDLLLALINEGEVPMTRIDESVRRILLMKKRLGLFENPFSPKNTPYPLVASDSFAKISYATAAESITLLKNNASVLPLSSNESVFITGPMANSLTMINGAWTRTWQGIDNQWDDTTKLTILEACRNNFKSSSFNPGCTIDTLQNIKLAQSLASKSDAIIVCIGESPSTEKPGDIHSLALSSAQVEYMKALKKTGKPIIAVLIENRARVVNAIEPLCDAIILAYQPSENGSQAIADILTGKVNPSGKLPITYPRHVNSLLLYDHKYTDQLNTDFSLSAFNPQWEFGHGLSYTHFTYSNLQTNSDQYVKDDTIQVSVDVSNTGDRDGKESVLVFVSDVYASITPSVKRLRRFDKKWIEKGSTETYEFNIPIQDLSFVNKSLDWVTEPGSFVIQIGDQKKVITLK